MTKFLHDPNAVLLYEMDWTSWLPAGETITTSTWPAVSGLTFDNTTIVSGNLKTRVRITGGVVGTTYIVTNRIVTSGSPTQTEDRSFQLEIVER